jgi:hypothetical protein
VLRRHYTPHRGAASYSKRSHTFPEVAHPTSEAVRSKPRRSTLCVRGRTLYTSPALFTRDPALYTRGSTFYTGGRRLKTEGQRSKPEVVRFIPVLCFSPEVPRSTPEGTTSTPEVRYSKPEVKHSTPEVDRSTTRRSHTLQVLRSSLEVLRPSPEVPRSSPEVPRSTIEVTPDVESSKTGDHTLYPEAEHFALDIKDITHTTKGPISTLYVLRCTLGILKSTQETFRFAQRHNARQ